MVDQSFIAEVAERVLGDNPQNLHQVTIVFPNRRAGLFFRKELSKLIEKQAIRRKAPHYTIYTQTYTN